MTKHLSKIDFIRDYSILNEYHEYDIEGLPIPTAVSVPTGEVYPELLPILDAFYDTDFKKNWHVTGGGSFLNPVTDVAKDNDFYWKAINEVWSNIFWKDNGGWDKDRHRYLDTFANGTKMMLNTDGRKIYFIQSGNYVYGFILNKQGTGPSVFQTHIQNKTSFGSGYGEYDKSSNKEPIAIIDKMGIPPELRVKGRNSGSDYRAIALVIRYLWPEVTQVFGELVTPESFSARMAYPSSQLSSGSSSSDEEDITNTLDKTRQYGLETASRQRKEGVLNQPLGATNIMGNPEVKTDIKDLLGNKRISGIDPKVRKDLFDVYKKGLSAPSDIQKEIKRLRDRAISR